MRQSQSLAMPSPVPLATTFTQIPFSRAMIKSSMESEAGRGKAAQCLHYSALHTLPTKEATHLLPDFSPSTPMATN